tara:strand:+ start:17623 stop:17868 length:246 start_codon:yes stop_codon:yes gene_type:complete
MKEFLKEKGNYSQGRVYLFLSIVVYYLTHGVILLAGIFDFDVDHQILKSVAEAIQYPMTTFATYTLGGKVVDIFKKSDKLD